MLLAENDKQSNTDIVEFVKSTECDIHMGNPMNSSLLKDEELKQPKDVKIRKRTASTVKHIFMVIPKNGYSPEEVDIDDILKKLFGFILDTCKHKNNPPRFKIFGDNIISVEFLRARRIDYDRLDFTSAYLIKRPFKSLYNSVSYLQLTMDQFFGNGELK
jgi:hypothetical protein